MWQGRVITNAHARRVPARVAHVSMRIARSYDWMAPFAWARQLELSAALLLGGDSSSGSRCLSKNPQQDRCNTIDDCKLKERRNSQSENQTLF